MKYETFVELLQDTSLYQVDDSPYLHSFEDNETDVTFSWDVEGLYYETVFAKEDIEKAQVKGNAVLIPDESGNLCTVYLWNISPAVITLQ